MSINLAKYTKQQSKISSALISPSAQMIRDEERIETLLGRWTETHFLSVPLGALIAIFREQPDDV